MKNTFKFTAGVIIGMIAMVIIMKVTAPFEYEYNKQDGTIVFNIDNEILSDYETLERRFDNDKGTTFKVYFEQE